MMTEKLVETKAETSKYGTSVRKIRYKRAKNKVCENAKIKTENTSGCFSTESIQISINVS
jgi:hypothetical protein